MSAPHSRLLDPREVPGASVPAGTGLSAAGLSTASLMAPAHLGLMPVRGGVLLALLHHKGFNDFFPELRIPGKCVGNCRLSFTFDLLILVRTYEGLCVLVMAYR